MKVSKFFFFLMGLFAVALILYVLTTPSSTQIQLTGIVTGTDEIVSPLVTGRLQKLLVDEGVGSEGRATDRGNRSHRAEIRARCGGRQHPNAAGARPAVRPDAGDERRADRGGGRASGRIR